MGYRVRGLDRPILSAVAISLVLACLAAQQASPLKFTINPEIQEALSRISADSLRGHLSFVASDLLEGRATPSRGLDIAAEYIASQFRRAGLEPVGDDGYFQTSNWLLVEQSSERFELKIHLQTETINIPWSQITLSRGKSMEFSRTALLKILYSDQSALALLTPEQAAGKAIVTEVPDYRFEDRSLWGQMLRTQTEFLARLRELNPAVVISIDRSGAAAIRSSSSQLIGPDDRPLAQAAKEAPPIISVRDPGLARLYDALKPGLAAATVSLRLTAPVEKPVRLRNVIGLLRGSDPLLKDTYVLVSAHYDHLGMRPEGEGDRIFNGANDDGSGTVSVVELASALSTLKVRPKRSIVFITFFGEERGLLGSGHYGRHPVFPLAKTVADINLEQVGRTDSADGPQLSSASLTGFDFSDVGAVFKAAGELTGVNVYKHEPNSDGYFGRSDNQPLADQGVPAHTLCVAYAYPDYHQPGDHWEKIDYTNMEKVDRMIALALIMIAENPEEPRWNESNPKAARYLDAWKERHAK